MKMSARQPLPTSTVCSSRSTSSSRSLRRLIVAATGIYQVDKFNFDYSDFWLSATIAILVVIFLVNILFFIPTDRRLLPIIEKAIADAGDRELKLSDLPPTYQRLGRAEGIVGSIMGILLIAAIFFMTTKPGLG